MMTEVGDVYLDDDEAEALRDYLLKGGFLWADDFWGEYAWAVWDKQFRKVLPTGPVPVPRSADGPSDLQSVLHDPRVSRRFRRSARGAAPAAERRSAGFDSRVPHARAVSTTTAGSWSLITHNTDFGDSFEEEATDQRVLPRFSVRRLCVRHQRAALRDEPLADRRRPARSRPSTPASARPGRTAAAAPRPSATRPRGYRSR